MAFPVQEADRIEILTLQDNYIDIAARDSTETVQRAMPVKDMEIRQSILAEHGFSALVTVTAGGTRRSLLFDFGFSEHGAAQNAEALKADLSGVEVLVLSHGHMDHFGGLLALARLVGRKGLDLVLHPSCLRRGRYLKVSDQLRLAFPALPVEKIEEAGIRIAPAREPKPLLGGACLFLGEVPRRTEFEKGFPGMCYLDQGREVADPLEDDTAVVMRLRGKGLVVLSGCAHAGIVNTVRHAQECTGCDRVHAVMGGFHLTGPQFEPVIRPTLDALKALGPDYVIPTHCTGRGAVLQFEREMGGQFLLNMSGTRIVLA